MEQLEIVRKLSVRKKSVRLRKNILKTIVRLQGQSMDHSPIRHSFKLENNFSTVGRAS